MWRWRRRGDTGWPNRSFHLQWTMMLSTFIVDSKSTFGIMKSGHAHQRVGITMLSLILARRMSSYVESISMMKIPEWYLFLFSSVLGNWLSKKACEFWLPVVSQMSGKKSARVGILTSKKSKQPPMKSLFTLKPQDPTIWALNGCPLRVFFAFAWITTHLPPQVEA